MKDESVGEIIKEFAALTAKAYTYLKDNSNENKNSKGTRKCIIKKIT